MNEERLSPKEYIKKAIVDLRRKNHKGMNTVSSGFNKAFEEYFDGITPDEAIKELAKQKEIIVSPKKRGVTIYLPNELPASNPAFALENMGLSADDINKISYESFVKTAILKLRQKDYKGIHTVYSGFNLAFKNYFKDEDPVKHVKQLEKDEKFAVRIVKGGVMIYLPEDASSANTNIASKALETMGLNLNDQNKLSHEEFVKTAILKLRQKDFKGIHAVFSGFNSAFKDYFKDEDPVTRINQLVKDKKFAIRIVKGGVMIYLPEDAPSDDIASKALEKMGLTPNDQNKLSHEEFVKTAILKLRQKDFKGIHAVYSGFNSAFKDYFKDEDPVTHIKQLVKDEKFATRIVKGGVMIYLPEDASLAITDIASKALANMGLNPNDQNKLSYEEFVKTAILKLRHKDYKGLHAVYSGFNSAFKDYFKGEDPVTHINQLVKDEKFTMTIVKGGVMIYLPEDRGQSNATVGKKDLKKMDPK